MDRRAGITYSAFIFSFWRMMVLIAVACALVIFVYTFIKVNLDTFDIESEIFAMGVMNSPGSIISYDTTTQRAYTWKIDLDDFEPGRLAEAFYFDENKYIAAKFEAMDLEEKQLASPIYYNREYYDIWEPLGYSFLSGRGGADVKESYYPVTFIRGAEDIQGILKMTILIPRS